MTDPPPLSPAQRWTVLVLAFLAWTFAGLGISLYVLIHRQLMLDLLGPDAPETLVTRWFAWFQAAFLFGAAAGGWLFGWLGDRLGRARALGCAVLCYSGFTLVAWFANTPEQHLVLRFLASMGIGGTWPGAVALTSEAWPRASRPLLAGLLGAAANVGFVLLGVLGYCVPITVEHWRWTLLVGASPAVLGLVILALAPESPTWQRERESSTATPTPLRDVFRPPLLTTTLLGIGLGAIPVVGTAANANWLVPWTDQVAQEKARETGQAVRAPADARSKALTQITRSSGATLGSFLGGLVAGLLGRRLSYFLISLGAFALSSLIFGLLDPLHAWFYFFTFLLGFVGVTYFGWLPLFLPALFPTHARATGAGISFNTGRVVAAFVVLSAGLLGDLMRGSYDRIGFTSGFIYVAGMALIWFAPREAERCDSDRSEARA